MVLSRRGDSAEGHHIVDSPLIELGDTCGDHEVFGEAVRR
jgi:hypothetical protein